MKRIVTVPVHPFFIEFDREEDGRWIAEIIGLPGVLAYGASRNEARRKVYAIALPHTCRYRRAWESTDFSIAAF